MKLVPIFNRSSSGAFELPSDGWYQLAPLGEYPVGLEINPATGLNAFGTKHASAVQVIDNHAVASMAQALVTGSELLIDFEHNSHDLDKSTEAAGWITKLESRAEGLWQQPRWSDNGEAAIKGGRWRYTSPSWMPDDCEIVSNTTTELRVRPLRITDAGLTNKPNLRGLKPLSNRAGELPTNQPTADNQNKKTMLKPETITALLAAFGLAADATDDQVTGAIAAEKTEDTAITNRLKTLGEELADHDLAKYGDRITEATKPAWRASLLSNRAGTIALLGGIVVPTMETPLTNRQKAKTPAADAADPAVAQKQTAAVKAIRNRDRCDFSTAWRTAQVEKPELF